MRQNSNYVIWNGIVVSSTFRAKKSEKWNSLIQAHSLSYSFDQTHTLSVLYSIVSPSLFIFHLSIKRIGYDDTCYIYLNVFQYINASNRCLDNANVYIMSYCFLWNEKSKGWMALAIGYNNHRLKCNENIIIDINNSIPKINQCWSASKRDDEYFMTMGLCRSVTYAVMCCATTFHSKNFLNIYLKRLKNHLKVYFVWKQQQQKSND